ncbi:MAG: immune inhibitor A, partial [Candidatus Edwardsbacteria bacterium]|nr:immune inhibitor A [Candidatus Edwardsbacteria bacterium]
MKRAILTVAIILIATIFAATAFAVPAKPGLRTFTQPDGSAFTGILKGDEHFSFGETPDGFSIIRNSTGWWTYARQENGLLVASAYIVDRDECPYSRHLRPNAEAIAKLPENAHKIINVSAEIRDQWAKQFLYGVGGTKADPKAPTGAKYCNIILGDFSDSTFAIHSAKAPGSYPWTAFSPNIYRRALWLVMGDKDSTKPVAHDSSTVGSMSNYYWEMTYNKCWWGQYTWGSGQITGVDTIRNSGKTWSSGNSATTAYLKAACDAADAAVDFRNPDDNTVQAGLMVVHPGPGEEESGRANDIWSASYSGLTWALDGITVTKCIVVPQNGQLGVYAHEMFHQLGAPDLYDYGYTGEPWGEWTLMDAGSWNGNPGGSQPAFAGGHLTYDINGQIGAVDGWLTQTDSISSARWGDGKYTIAVLDSAGEARRGNITGGIRLWRIRNNNFRDSAQVFFVENRRRTPPYEAGLPEDGLIITHIDTRMAGAAPNFNGGPPGTRAYYSWVESPGFDPNPLYAAGDSNLPRRLEGAAYSADDYSLGGYQENRIDSTSIPNSWINKCYGTTTAKTGPWIIDISREGPTMTFNVLRTGLAAAAPLVSFMTATVLDPLGGGAANNNNGLLDPWETDSIKLTFLNSGAAITAGATCSLYAVKNDQWVSFPAPGWKTVGAGTIAKDAQAESAPFVVTVDKSTPRFTDITFGVKFKSTTPAYTDTSYFTLRISPFKVVFTYNFANIQVGGATYSYRIKPTDLAVYRDTLYVANGNLDLATWQTRIYKVKKNTTNNPLIATDTIRSMNNKGTVNDANKYIGGIDVDNNGNLWYSIQDSCYQIGRQAPSPTVVGKFKMPNVSWGGTPMKRIRGVALGPSVIDTVGPDPLAGDSLWGYWQIYEPAFDESLYVMSKVTSGSGTIRQRFGFTDSDWGAGYGGNWWNGRALDFDGTNLWTSSVWQNLLIKRRATDARITMVMPGPSTFGSYGTYGVAHEATDAAGVPYAPVGTVAYAPYKRGNKHYLYCASMDEGKIYKIVTDDFIRPTPCDSVVPKYVNATQDWVVWYKTNADTQKVQGYIICGRTDQSPPVFPTDSMNYKQSTRAGGLVSPKDSILITHAKGKAVYYYTVVPVNYGGEAGYGASVPANPLAVELME